MKFQLIVEGPDIVAATTLHGLGESSTVTITPETHFPGFIFQIVSAQELHELPDVRDGVDDGPPVRPHVDNDLAAWSEANLPTPEGD
jgi:hypothetical protein